MKPLQHLFDQNQQWAQGIKEDNPHFFEELAKQQKPEYLWIGCADSRVPANQVLGLKPGSVFVHRNIANMMGHTDANSLSVLHYAVKALRVKHVIVCGHYGCGGVQAALSDSSYGFLDGWIRHIKEVYACHHEELDAMDDIGERTDRLVEHNVRQQVMNVAASTVVQDAWREGHALHIHGWAYALKEGLLHDLNMHVDGPGQLSPCHQLKD